MCKLERGINIICEQKSGLYPLLILGKDWGGVNKILPLLILGEGWGGVKFIKKPIGFPIGFKYVRVRRFIITYVNNSANGPFGSAMFAATAPSSANFKPGKTTSFKPFVTLATVFGDTLKLE